MGLKGSLRDFGISEILQLIGLQHRTGRLEVKSEDAEYHILINTGRIVQVEKKPEIKGEGLSDYLLRANAVPKNQLKLAEAKSKAELKPLEATLVSLEFISALDIKTYIFTRNLDILHQLFLLKDGEYEFNAEPVNYHPSYTVEIETEQLLMDGYRIKDEWGPLISEIGSLDNIFQKRGGEFGPADRLEESTAKVYNLIDGNRNIDELASLCQMTKFETIKALAELKRWARIEPVKRVIEKPEERKPMVSNIFNVGFWVLIVVLVGLFANGLRLYISKGVTGAKPQDNFSWQEERIRGALEIYRIEQDNYPGSIIELGTKGILRIKDLKFAEKGQYYSKEGGYTFTMPKP